MTITLESPTTTDIKDVIVMWDDEELDHVTFCPHCGANDYDDGLWLAQLTTAYVLRHITFSSPAETQVTYDISGIETLGETTEITHECTHCGNNVALPEWMKH